MRLSGHDLRAGMAGEEVGELHTELIQLGFTIPEAERRDHIFGVVTARAVAEFQRAHGLWDTAVVDRNTAAALTRALADVGEETVMIWPQRHPQPQPAPQPRPVAVPGPTVPGPTVPGPTVPGPTVPGPTVPGPTVPGPTTEPGPAPEPYAHISGRIFLEYGGPAADLRLRAYRRGFGGTATRLAETSTGPDGTYGLSYQTAGAATNLEIRAVGADGTEVSLTLTAFAVAPGDVLNLVAPASVRPLGAEYQRLLTDVTPHLDGGRLGQARETEEQPDLTLIQETTGWDARLVAFAAQADRVAAATGIPAQAAYALLRAGLPDDPVGLAGVSVSAVDRALTEAAAAGVVELVEAERAAALEAFSSFGQATRLATVALGALSSQAEMLAVAGLSADAAARFDGIYAANAREGGDPAELWRRAQAAGLPVEALRLTGKLGYLTVNNAALTASLQPEMAGDLGPALASKELYRPREWVRRLTALAARDGTAVADLVPPAFTGDTARERVRAYTEDLARKVRIGYPTEVISHQVATGQLPLGDAGPDTAAFLDRAAGLGLALGRTPVTAMLRDHGDKLLAGVQPARVATVTEGVRTLQRIYQITPSDEAMKVLLDKGIRSAHDVTGMSYAKFLSRHGASFSTMDEASLVYRKAQQVEGVTSAVIAAAHQLVAAPSVFALADTDAAHEDAKTELIKHFPTMEQLFGSMDYCDCDHCRSVLSPAAYLVDLLHFLDPPAEEWQAEMDLWLTEHAAPYPFADAQAWQDFRDQWAIDHPDRPEPATGLTPYQVLTRRRPDLVRLPLTCENTNTVLPYLDVVNEILEFYVAHGRLTPDAVRDTGAALAADLLAEPQYLIPRAYEVLRTAAYPLAVPFDLWLETLRRLLTHFGTPLWMVLDAFRRTDSLYPSGGEPYGRAAVAIERLGLSMSEHALLTDPDPWPRWHERYGYPTEAQALDELSNAKNLSRRLGVTYQELLDLVTTSFVSPGLAGIPALPKLGLGVADVLRYRGAPGHALFSDADRADFEALLVPIGGPVGLDELWATVEPGRILVLADLYSNGNFDTVTLQYADGTPADPIAFLTLNYLVRLWRRLDWSLAETERALQVCLPTEPDPRDGATLGPAMASALLGLSRLDTVREHLKADRSELLELWSDLTATRYAQLFLVPGTPPIDPVFDQPLGRYLQYLDGGEYRPYHWDPTLPESAADGNVGLAAHAGTVQAALQLSADDVGRILADAGTTLADAPLDLATVSLLHRYGVLARRLRMPVADLIALRQLSGLDPFLPPHPRPVLTLEEDHPHTTVRFVEAALKLRDGGLPVTEVDYLLRHRYDPAGPYLSAAAPPLTLVRTLDTEIGRIRTEHADPIDPTALTDEELRQKMALVLAADAVERFFGMWTGTITYDAVITGVDPADQLDPASVAGEPAITLTYDPLRAEQHLVYRGVLVERDKQRLVSDHPGPADATARYTELLDSVARTAREFFDLNLLAPVGFLAAADYDRFFAPARPGADDADLQERLAQKRGRLIAAFLPYLRDQLIDQVVLSTVGAEFPDATDLVTSLVTEPTLLADRLWPGEALLAAYRAAGDRGVTATADGTAQTAGFDAYLEVATAGSYRFFVSCQHAGTVVDLRFDHLTDAALLVATTADGEEPSVYLDLSPGAVYHFRLATTGTGGGTVTPLVMGENLPKGHIDRLTCHPGDAVERVRRAHVLLDKAIRLASGRGLVEAELRHLLTHPGDFGGLTLGALPVTEDEDVPAAATALFWQVHRLLNLVALRRDTGTAPGELTDLLAHARRTYPQDLGRAGAAADLLADMHARMAVLTRRDTATVAEAADRLRLVATARTAGDVIQATAPGFVDEIGLGRLWTVLTLAGRVGVTPTVLATTATAAPDMTVARQLRDALRACYDVAAWRRVAQPIFDALRQRRRDALVAWVMHADGFDRLEQLFEFFLVDPGTEPVVQTSRLRLAISAVQLFVQRCQLNLEPDVSAWAINSEHWQWMKRYRVWEANRKIFLWPENWLEPEFRDDKTHLFRALESSLFQSEVTNDLAEEALFGYLRSLEAMARLDIRAIYVEEREADPVANTLHVVGRTFGAPHAYFYRSHSYGMWTPWVPVTVEIESDHLVAAVWRDRPHLFWVTFNDTASRGGESRSATALADASTDEVLGPRRIEVRLHWTEYYQGEWSDRVSGGLTAPIVAEVLRSWSPANEQVHVSHDGDALLLHINGFINRALRIESKNSPPVPGTVLAPPEIPYPSEVMVALPDPAAEPGAPSSMEVAVPLPFSVSYVDRLTTHDIALATPVEHTTTEQILDAGYNYTLRVACNPVTTPDPETATLQSPVFYQDNRHTFFVEPALTEVTLSDWSDWLIPSVTVITDVDEEVYWQRRAMTGQVPATDPVPAGVIAPVARFQLDDRADWVIRPGTAVAYDGGVILGPSTSVTAAFVNGAGFGGPRRTEQPGRRPRAQGESR